MSNPMRDLIFETIERGLDLDSDGLANLIVAQMAEVQTTVTLSLVSRVMALEESLRRLADAAYPIADHERAYPVGAVETVIEGRALGPDDGVHRVTVQHLRDLAEAVSQAEDAFWPAESVDLAPELLHER